MSSVPAEDPSVDDNFRSARRAPLRTLLPYLWPKGMPIIRARVIGALVCIVLAKLSTVSIPLFYRDAVDALSGKAASEGSFLPTAMGIAGIPVALLVGYGLVRLLSVVFQQMREAFFARVAQHAIRTVALQTFRHLHALSLRYHLERQTGGLNRLIERGVKGIDFLLSFTLFNILPTLFEIVMVCGILWGLFDYTFALVTLATIIAYIAFTLTATEWRLKFRRNMNESDSRANTRAIDSLINYETVKYFGNEGHEERRYDWALRRYEDASVKSVTSLSMVNIGQGGIIAAGLVALMVLAADGVQAGRMTIGDFVLVNTYLIQLYMPLNFLGFVYRQIRQALTDMEDMFTLLNIPQEITDRPGAVRLEAPEGRLTFDHVFFGYDTRRPILKDVSFTVEPGRMLAIVGPSGAGKSTISRLLFRFYDPQDGAVRIDGHDLRDLTQKSVRAAIGIVPQDTVLFNDTIEYNIAYGRPDASTEEIRRAAEMARIHDFITALPDGYDTVVGERGLKLSGGEKQRVAIARAILKAPRIMLFDEATSALDTATEREIQASLKEVSTGRTTLVIAHRLSTVVDADEIIVMRDGSIVERGTHKSLLAEEGLYLEMWRRQQQGDDTDPPV
ncbi:ABCB family ABC transporter ATP-binding protein/permease [Pacificispira spongiicola]|uniref:ABCB family ABC transporter ATP-binding protein/permease n=1 Tax=Pacificispira spongiicola TaxID=2729598 RepID=UPI001D0C506B|nr:ABC transporter ATP-binding protein/permease [Pacificispira spongiicola]